MEKEIKNLVRRLKCEYAAMWGFALLTVCLYECEALPSGTLVNDELSAYLFQLVCMLLTLGLIYMALRLLKFSMPGKADIPAAEMPKLLVSYRRLSEVRLALLLVPALADLTAYYATFNNNVLLCAGMVALASLFCIPGKGRLLTELHLHEEQEQAKAE